MKIAVIDHIGNPGGGSRVARALLPAMMSLRSDLDITFFGNPHAIKRERLDELAGLCGIKVAALNSMKISGKDLFGIRGSRHLVSLMQRKLSAPLQFAPSVLSGAVHRELEKKVRGFDLAFFTWPFHLKRPNLDCPVAGIFHDYNYKYYFSGHAMAPWVVEFLETQMPDWLEHSTPIVSTEFMRTEVQKFYPKYGHKVNVVPIAPMSLISPVTDQNAPQIIKKFNLPERYLLCPTNISSHKNVGPLISSLVHLSKKGIDIPLVFAGSGTEIINGRACLVGIERVLEGKNVYGLGYVSNEEIDALIQCAAVVVNPSLYEGGNGAGFDAWARGVPVAMSNIPPFLEHLSAHGVKSMIFDPRSPEDIAQKLGHLLLDQDIASEFAKVSKESIARFNWEYSAKGYLSVFDQMLANKVTI